MGPFSPSRTLKLSRAILLSGLASLGFACGGGDGVSPEEAASEVTDAMCEWIGQCGQWEIDCSGDPETCAATLVEVPHAECVTDRELDFAGVECGDLTADEEALVDDCVAGLVARACITQAQVDAYLEALAKGEQPEEPGEAPPAACVELEEVLVECLDVPGRQRDAGVDRTAPSALEEVAERRYVRRRGGKRGVRRRTKSAKGSAHSWRWRSAASSASSSAAKTIPVRPASQVTEARFSECPEYPFARVAPRGRLHSARSAKSSTNRS